MRTYVVKSFREAASAKWPGIEHYDDTDRDWSGFGVWEVVDHVPLRLIGGDGGWRTFPMDQTLIRDWAWVVGALNAAYEAGRIDACHDLVSV